MKSLALKVLRKVLRKLTNAIPNRQIRMWTLHNIHVKMEECEPELRKLEKLLPRQRRHAIDIGANFGSYSIELSRFFEHVTAFEINPDLSRDLSQLSSKIEVKDVGLSSATGTAILYIPLLDGNSPLFGWASLTPGNSPDTDIHREKTVNIDQLDSFKLEQIDFIKIDVEGHELDVLKGARNTLASNSPRLLIEIMGEKKLDAVCQFLQQFEYEKVDMKPLIGQKSDENYFFQKRVAGKLV